MAEVVGPTDAEDGDTRTDGLQEVARARSQAPVMRHLEDAQRRTRNRLEQGLLDVPANVARQENRHVPPAHLDHQRIVVPNALALPVRRRRMPHHHIHIVDRDVHAAVNVGPACSDRPGLQSQRRERIGARHRNPLPHLARPEVAKNGRGAADVIGVAVGQGEIIDVPDTACP